MTTITNDMTVKMNDGSHTNNDIQLDELLKLDNQLCFSLYVCSKEIIRKYKPLLDPFGLTYTGYITLLALWEKDEVTIKALGKKLFLDSGTLTPLLKKLEALGYIKRIRSLLDERNVYIKLTQKGTDLKAKAFQIPVDLLCSANLETPNASQLLDTLHQVMQQIAR